MKKIGILTFHAAHNYGSMLQAFALKQYVTHLGFDCEIINYQNHRQQRLYSVLSVGIKTNLFRILHLQPYLKRYYCFREYLTTFLSKAQYIHSENDVRAQISNYDAVICGSDQIWNMSSTTYDSDLIYFLPFNYKGRKIAYAPSMGSNIDNEYIRTNLFKYLEDYSFLSTRELKLSLSLQNLLNRSCETVLDPTLLLEKKDWNGQFININEHNYICFYSLIYSKELVDFTIKASHELNLKIINLSPRAKYANIKEFKQKYDIGPKEFISYIKNANLVITNSFHGSVFSLINHVPLFSIIVNNVKDYRRQNLFETIHLNELYFSCNSIGSIAEKYEEVRNISYEKAEAFLSKEREKSIKYLRNALTWK